MNVCVNNSLGAKVRNFCLCAKDKHMSDVWLFSLFFYRAPIYCEGVALIEAISIAILCPDKGIATFIAYAVGTHYALVAYGGRAGVVESHPGSLLEAICHLQELPRLVDIHLTAEYRELKQPAMRHAAYHLAQFKAILAGDEFPVGRANRCKRGVGIEYLIFCQAFLDQIRYTILLHSYITSPPKINPPNTATAMKPRRPAMVIATSP